MAETVLIFGASGNMGLAAVISALKTGQHAIAVMRNKASVQKIFKYASSREGITIAEADINSEESIRGVVDQVRAGKLPSFQHVWASPGRYYWDTSILDLDLATMREMMAGNFETYFITYRATVPYLIEKGLPNSTWTLCTGAQGELGLRAAPALSQGALFSFAIAAFRETENTNIRCNEVFLAYRVQAEYTDAELDQWRGLIPVMTSAEFAPLYEQLLHRTEIKGSRVSAVTPADVKELKYASRI